MIWRSATDSNHQYVLQYHEKQHLSKCHFENDAESQ